METSLPIPNHPLECMNQLELYAFITKVLQTELKSTQKVGSNKEQRPEWWPGGLSFSSIWNDGWKASFNLDSWALKDLVYSCYRYHGKECLLTDDMPVSNENGSVKVVNNENGSVSLITDQAVVTLEKRQNTEYAVHSPKMGLAESCKVSTPLAAVYDADVPHDIAHTDCRPFHGQCMFRCSSCEQEFIHKHLLIRHQRFSCKLYEAGCNPNPYRTRLSNLPVHQKGREETVVVRPRKRQKLVEENVTFPSKSVYVEILGLLPHSKASRIQSHSLTKVVNCNMLELGDENIPPAAPSTPCSRRSLISQFREASPLSHQPKYRRDCDPIQNASIKDVDRSESVSSGDTEEQCVQHEPDDNYKPRRVVSLLNIDLTSLLGNRVRRQITAHYDSMESDSNYQHISYECYCRTPRKTRETGRLRNRGQEFQITFRKTKHTAPKHYHQYKFSRAQLREFCRLLETGLNRRSRILRRQLPKCKVVLEPLSEADLKRWCPQYKLPGGSTGCSLLAGAAHLELAKLEDTSKSSASSNSSGNSSVGLDDDDDDIVIVEDLEPPSVKQTQNDDLSSAHRQRRKSPVIPRQWIDDGDTKFDDVISISSSDSEDDLEVVSYSSQNVAGTSAAAPPCENQRVRQEMHPSALLFRCHICSEEIICAKNANLLIKQHFASCHDVYNIKLVEHFDSSGQKVFSIIDVSNSLKRVTSVRNSGKRFRSPLSSRDVCNENNLPNNERKKMKELGKTALKIHHKNNRKGIKLNKSVTLKVSPRNKEGHSKMRSKTKSSASRSKNLPRKVKTSSRCVTARHNHRDTLPPRRTIKRNNI